MTRPDTIGGHSREALIWACSPGFNNENCVTTSMVKAVAFRVTRDPAELAELLAEALRERGWHVCDLGCTADETASDFCASSVGFEVSAGVDTLCIAFDGYARPEARHVSMPQARAALLRILELPEDATAEDAVKALEVGK